MRRMHLLLTTLAVALFVAMLILQPTGASAAPSCRGAAIVQAAASDFMRAGRSGSPARLRAALNRHVNMRSVMRFALGRNIRRLKGTERQRFYRQGSQYAARRLAQLARSVHGTQVKVVRCRGSRVETQLLPGGERIVWKLRGGRIADVHFRGVSMVMLLRDHFRRMWRSAGNDAEAFLAQLN